jgi:hypothetical protein
VGPPRLIGKGTNWRRQRLSHLFSQSASSVCPRDFGTAPNTLLRLTFTNSYSGSGSPSSMRRFLRTSLRSLAARYWATCSLT